jgi:hypothetical protein
MAKSKALEHLAAVFGITVEVATAAVVKET